jgi:Kinesin motor domain
LIDVIFNGFNCSVFVYGATGSGKTHTMLGKENTPGITLRTVIELYKRIEEVNLLIQGQTAKVLNRGVSIISFDSFLLFITILGSMVNYIIFKKYKLLALFCLVSTLGGNC